jgi:hypothetical protein
MGHIAACGIAGADEAAPEALIIRRRRNGRRANPARRLT